MPKIRVEMEIDDKVACGLCFFAQFKNTYNEVVCWLFKRRLLKDRDNIVFRCQACKDAEVKE